MDREIFLIIVGMAVVTYVPRALPLVVLAGRPLAPGWSAWLGYVPVAVLAAMLAPELLLQEGTLAITLDNRALIAAVPTFLIALVSRSLPWTVLGGMVVMAILQFLSNP